MNRNLAGLTLAFFTSICTLGFAQTWYKGNLHTHTNNSDGDTVPGTVARWYRDHNYDFIAITDHNKLTATATIQSEINAENQASGHKPFLLIPGEEVSDNYAGKSIHLNAINITSVISPQGGSSISDTIQRNVDAINARSGAIAILNHPNLGSGISMNDIHAVRNLKFWELYNGHPDANNGGPPAPMGENWDNILSRPHTIFGLGTDDAHKFQVWGSTYANPGRSWICVRATALTATALVDAIKKGDFYLSTGVTYSNVTTTNNTLTVTMSGAGPFTTTFYGRDGNVLSTQTSNPASYGVPQGRLYARAKTNTSYGSAWTQPLIDKTYIIDNSDAGFAASSNWVIGTSAADKYGSNYEYRSVMNGSPDRATWTAGTAGTGLFDIYAWWNVGTAGNRTPQAHYFIPGGAEVIVDQRINGGKWNLLGTVQFNAEGNHTVELAAGGLVGYAVIADAVKMYGPK